MTTYQVRMLVIQIAYLAAVLIALVVWAIKGS